MYELLQITFYYAHSLSPQSNIFTMEAHISLPQTCQGPETKMCVKFPFLPSLPLPFLFHLGSAGAQFPTKHFPLQVLPFLDFIINGGPGYNLVEIFEITNACIDAALAYFFTNGNTFIIKVSCCLIIKLFCILRR